MGRKKTAGSRMGSAVFYYKQFTFLYDNVHRQATYPFTDRTAHLPGYGSLTYVRN